MRSILWAGAVVMIAAAGVLGAVVSTADAHETRSGEVTLIVGWLEEPAIEGQPNGISVRISAPMEHEDEPDDGHDHEAAVDDHGAVFASGPIDVGGEFSYVVPEELAGLVVEYHNHLDHEMAGSIHVHSEGHGGETIAVEAQHGAYLPAEIEVAPGDTIVWRNTTDEPSTVISGPPSSAPGADAATEMLAPVAGLSGLKAEVTYVPTGAVVVAELRERFGDPGHYAATMIPTAPGGYRFRVFGQIEGLELDETFDSGPGTFDDVQTAADLQFPSAVAAAREIEGAARGAQAAADSAAAEAGSASDDASAAQGLAIAGIVVGGVGTLLGAASVAVAVRRRR